ncbi:gephyrin-like molybdotransferase Glp [Gryllotalpicola reticulitermitis]|uniref:Molybdopterin molybdenumtransferase n=1 Tax=Gryllotalpicola reticulitermitis TaxID=1184153 RepID=A0ABV8Q4K7_9MICO
MTSVDEHRARVRALISDHWHPAPERVLLGAALGRILAADVTTPIDLPPFDNSQMDGYAVRADASSGALRVTGHIAAGDGIAAFEGGAVAIMTGAPLPRGADAVVPIEAVSDAGEFAPVGSEIRLREPVAAGTFVRAHGSDLVAGTVLLASGTRLGPPQLGALAAAGVIEVSVLTRPRVLIVSTGAELAAAGTPLAPGKIYDANSTSLAAAVTEAGAVALAATVDSDDPGHLRFALDSAGPVDLVITSGGVSVGAHEVVRDALEPLGLTFGAVAMQPGGPQGLGVATIAGRPTPVLAFPGNPVSVLVSFELFLRPLLRGPRPVQWAPLAISVDSPPAKHQVRRGRLDADGRVELVGGPSSHLIAAYAGSQALVHLPVGVARAEAGDLVELWRIDD